MPEQLPHADYISPYYQVVKQHSSVTAQKDLWEVKSRMIRGMSDAESWLEFCQSDDPDGEYFIVSVHTEFTQKWTRENEFRIRKSQMDHVYQGDRALHKIGTLVDKIRYAMDHGIQNNYVLDLLDMFDEETADYKHE